MAPFISYAQNFEDLVLWRALKDIEAGFYIDVGAFSPERDSVTCAFYERGWRGINIEPHPDSFADFPEARPLDINLQVAVGEKPGHTVLYTVQDNAGLNTLDADVAQMHAAAGYDTGCEEAPVRTLAEICEQHLDDARPIHFLKVDVEGAELGVIKGADWSRFRPWIVVVEATVPNSQQPNHHQWEPLLMAAGYQHIYSDGLNRFYLAEERSSLKASFRYPPNVFDNFIIAGQRRPAHHVRYWRRRYLLALDRRLALENELAATETRASKAEERAKESAAALERMKNRLAWRITAPLRFADQRFSAFCAASLNGLKRIRAFILRHLRTVVRGLGR